MTLNTRIWNEFFPAKIRTMQRCKNKFLKLGSCIISLLKIRLNWAATNLWNSPKLSPWVLPGLLYNSFFRNFPWVRGTWIFTNSVIWYPPCLNNPNWKVSSKMKFNLLTRFYKVCRDLIRNIMPTLYLHHKMKL